MGAPRGRYRVSVSGTSVPRARLARLPRGPHGAHLSSHWGLVSGPRRARISACPTVIVSTVSGRVTTVICYFSKYAESFSFSAGAQDRDPECRYWQPGPSPRIPLFSPGPELGLAGPRGFPLGPERGQLRAATGAQSRVTEPRVNVDWAPSSGRSGPRCARPGPAQGLARSVFGLRARTLTILHVRRSARSDP